MKFSPRYKWLGLVLLLIVMLFGAEKAFDFGMRHNLNLKAAFVSTDKINAEVLVLGPCEPLWMVAPERVTKTSGMSCYNLAASHSDFADNFLHLSFYLQHQGAPRYLLVYVTPESFDVRYNTFHSYLFAPYFSDPAVKKTVLENDRNYAFASHVPFVRYGYYGHRTTFLALQGWKHYFTHKQQPYYPDGFEPPAKIAWDNHHENMKKLYPKGYSFMWDSTREKYLHKILDLCAAKKVNVVLYESPILKEISDYQVNRILFVERIRAIAEKHNIEYVQFDKLSWAADRKYFISPMVATLEGAYLFSDTLGRWLREKTVK